MSDLCRCDPDSLEELDPETVARKASEGKGVKFRVIKILVTFSKIIPFILYGQEIERVVSSTVALIIHSAQTS